MRANPIVLLVALCSNIGTLAWAGRGSSTAALKSAIATGSVDSIIAEVERAEFLACVACINPVLKLVDHPEYRVRDVAGWWLGRRAVRAELLEMGKTRLASSDAAQARNIADVLGAMHEIRALPQLSTFLANPLDDESGVAAARAIGRIGSATSVQALAAGTKSKYASVRAQSLAAMRELRAPDGAATATNSSIVVPLLGDSDMEVRREAAYTLGRAKAADSVNALQAALKDQAAPVRKAAAWALGQIGSSAATTALSAAQSDSDPFVRSIARAALARLR